MSVFLFVVVPGRRCDAAVELDAAADPAPHGGGPGGSAADEGPQGLHGAAE